MPATEFIGLHTTCTIGLNFIFKDKGNEVLCNNLVYNVKCEQCSASYMSLHTGLISTRLAEHHILNKNSNQATIADKFFQCEPQSQPSEL